MKLYKLVPVEIDDTINADDAMVSDVDKQFKLLEKGDDFITDYFHEQEWDEKDYAEALELIKKFSILNEINREINNDYLIICMK